MAGVCTGVLTRRIVLSITSLLLLCCGGATASEPLRGFNYLQLPQVTLDQPAARESMRRMQALGANMVVLIPFFRQFRAESGEIGFSDAVTDRQLMAAIENARHLGLGVVLKPQILVDNGWAGDIRFGSDADEERWFERYRDLLTYYARLAEREQVDAFVIGTELSGIESSARWPEVVAAIRKVYSGTLTYAAHGVKGVRRFSSWLHLDVVAVNLYPALGENADAAMLRENIEVTLSELKEVTQRYSRPVWVLEVGIPSAQGALSTPWDWRRLNDVRTKPDMAVQSNAFAQWLAALDKPWIDAVFIWCWYSDPAAGGLGNNDYTLQNKPAEKQVGCLWGGDCIGSQE